MPSFSTRALVAAVIATGLASATDTVSLSSFKPKIQDLPSECHDVYMAPIEDCQVSDFQSGAVCSEQCVQSIAKLVKTVNSECAGVEVPQSSILDFILRGQGLQALCPNVDIVFASSSTQTPARTTSASSRQPSSTTLTEEAESTTSTTASSSSTGVTIDTTVASTLVTTAAPSIIVDPSSAPPVATTVGLQKSNLDSGGGSPFDIQVTAGSPSFDPLRSIVIGVVAAAVAMGLAAI